MDVADVEVCPIDGAADAFLGTFEILHPETETVDFDFSDAEDVLVGLGLVRFRLVGCGLFDDSCQVHAPWTACLFWLCHKVEVSILDVGFPYADSVVAEQAIDGKGRCQPGCMENRVHGLVASVVVGILVYEAEVLENHRLEGVDVKSGEGDLAVQLLFQAFKQPVRYLFLDRRRLRGNGRGYEERGYDSEQESDYLQAFLHYEADTLSYNLQK